MVGTLVAFTVGYAVLLAGWAYALHTASRGSRGGLIAAFALNALFWLGISIGTLSFYCPGGCSMALLNIANWLNLILGLLAGVALAMVLWRKQAQP